MKKILICLLVLLSVMAAVCSCGSLAPQTQNGKLQIVAVNFPAYDFCRSLAGEKADITMLLSPGEEAHSFDPTPKDIMKVTGADLFVYGGGESDNWAQSILSSSQGAKRVISMMDTVEVYEEEIKQGMDVHETEDEKAETEYDEHVWTSPKNAKRICEEIAKALCELDESNEGFYTDALTAYSDRLTVLDTAFRSITDAAQRKHLVFADRFPFLYFVREYGLDYSAAFPGCSGETEASPGTIAYLIDRVKEENIPCVLKLELSNDSMAKNIASHTGTDILTFYSCQTVTKADFESGETYISLMERNINTLSKALN